MMNEMRGDSVPVSSTNRALPALFFLFVTVVAALWSADRFTRPEGMAFVGSEPTGSPSATASPSRTADVATPRNPGSQVEGPGGGVDLQPMPDQSPPPRFSADPDDR